MDAATFPTPAWLVVLLGIAAAIARYPPIQKAVETLLTRWVEKRPVKVLAKRLPDAEVSMLLVQNREEIETIALLLLREYQASRVTVVEYTLPSDGSWIATCTAEAREYDMFSVKSLWQNRKLHESQWRFIEHIMHQPTRTLYVRDIRELDPSPLRTALIHSGGRSAFYQVLLTASGAPGALLTVTWKTDRSCSPEDCAALTLSGRMLGPLLRVIWASRKGDSSSLEPSSSSSSSS